MMFFTIVGFAAVGVLAMLGLLLVVGAFVKAFKD